MNADKTPIFRMEPDDLYKVRSLNTRARLLAYSRRMWKPGFGRKVVLSDAGQRHDAVPVSQGA